MRTTIPWGDGSGDNIYLDYSVSEGSQTVQVSSDANAGIEPRTKNITFSALGASSVVLTVVQSEGYDLILITNNDTAITYTNETAVGYKIPKV